VNSLQGYLSYSVAKTRVLLRSSYDLNYSSIFKLVNIYLRQGGYVIVLVCLSVSNFAQKLPNGFGGDPNHGSGSVSWHW